MPLNGLIKFALGLANVPDSTIADLDRALPGMQRLAEAAKQLQPILQKADPLIQQAMPILRKAYPDAVAVLPTVEEKPDELLQDL